ncbi:MAG: hypothetical protein KKC68_08575 [Candidatus Thermoplasmatota archaeon]|nr:hypothetical protein [Candidatus Thermoplasmatota archaeon]
MQLKYFVIFLAVVSISLLYLLSYFIQPVFIDIEKIAQYEGKEVIIEGQICDYYITSYGSQIITVQTLNKSHSFELTLFVETISDVDYGDIIQATGTVQKFQEKWELVVNTARNIKVLTSWHNISYPLKQLAENPQKYEGYNVQITGIIDRIYDSYCYITDSLGKYTIAVYFNEYQLQNVTEGKIIQIKGRFHYHQEHLRYIIDMHNSDSMSEGEG